MKTYFKCLCGEENELREKFVTDCEKCCRRYWRYKDETGKLYAKLTISPLHYDDIKKIDPIETYKKSA